MRSTDSINKEYFKNKHPRTNLGYGMFLFYCCCAPFLGSIYTLGFFETIKDYSLTVFSLIVFIPAIWCTYKFFIFLSYKKADQYSPSRILWENERNRKRERLSKLYNKYLGWYLRPAAKIIGVMLGKTLEIMGAALKIIGLIIGLGSIPFIIDAVDAVLSGYTSNQVRFEKYVEERLDSYCHSIMDSAFREHLASDDKFKAYHAGRRSSIFSQFKLYFSGYAPQNVLCEAGISYESNKENLSPETKIRFSIIEPAYLPRYYKYSRSYNLSIKQLNNLYPRSSAIRFSYMDYINRHPTPNEVINKWAKAFGLKA